MKKLITYLTEFHCISCDQTYQNFSISSKEVKLETCSNCHPYYNKESSGTKIGKVFSAFEKRFEKTTQLKKVNKK